MKKQILKSALIAMAGVGLMAGSANALIINGEVWTGITDATNLVRTFDTSQDSTATFNINGIFNFDTRSTGEPSPITYGDFLNGENDTNIVTWLTGTNLNSTVMDTADNFAGSFFQFTGTAYFDANEQITHDDGVWITLISLSDGSIYQGGFDDPTAPRTTDLGNAAGNYAFTLNYIESNQLPAVLKMSVDPVPEPTTMLLFGTGLLGLAAIGRRKETE